MIMIMIIITIMIILLILSSLSLLLLLLSLGKKHKDTMITMNRIVELYTEHGLEIPNFELLNSNNNK